MEVVAGVDVGSIFTKAVVIELGGKVVSFSVARTLAGAEKAGRSCLNEALRTAGLEAEDIRYVVSTGYGRVMVPFADKQVTEITCHAQGAASLFPDVRTVIDIGGQDSKVISVGDEAKVKRFLMNDKCAAGTGRFLEVMADALGTNLEEMSSLSFQSNNNIEVSSLCTVFAESEVVSLVSTGQEMADIAAAIFRSISKRMIGMIGQVGLIEKVVMTGGVAKIKGQVHALEEVLHTELVVPENPQIVGALGAAILAARERRRQMVGREETRSPR
jgi:predicted CoA-substrate-specific enzyme activase